MFGCTFVLFTEVVMSVFSLFTFPFVLFGLCYVAWRASDARRSPSCAGSDETAPLRASPAPAPALAPRSMPRACTCTLRALRTAAHHHCTPTTILAGR